MKHFQFFVFLCFLTFSVSCGQQKKYIQYKVKEGETMRNIAKKLDMKTKDLLRLNPDVDRRPVANTVIVIPNKQFKNVVDTKNGDALNEIKKAANDFRARGCSQRCDNRGINSAGHSHNNAAVLRIAGKVKQCSRVQRRINKCRGSHARALTRSVRSSLARRLPAVVQS